MRTTDKIQDFQMSRARAEKAVHAQLQHELNAVHVYCHLRGLIGDRNALAFARKWERSIIYSHVIYRNIS
ncbi:MAG: hypothetical protein P4L55_13010 [Syntrophobacteraceae bacterium]|nr:hypothetical protein [Syntrophobacteraceae bacterium]